MGEQIMPSRVCVAGASGRIGSLLVKKLLQRGHVVHATVRNLCDPEKTEVVKSLPGADSRLHLFEVDLFKAYQFEQAIQGCEFVFLVAFPTRPAAEDFKFYTTNKTASERRLMSYGDNKEGGKNSSLEVVVLTCGQVGGGALVDKTVGVNEIISPLTGDAAAYSGLAFLQKLLCSVPLVHQDDVCEAHVFCMDVPLTHCRRFLCASSYPTLREIVAYYQLNYSDLLVAKEPEECPSRSIKGGSTRLRDMGFQYKYGMEQILDDSVRFGKKVGLLKDG